MAVTILGVIAATIGGVLVAAFNATAGINDRFDASRASKQASLYWAPDVQSVETVNPATACGGGVGPGSAALITFQSFDHPPLSEAPAPPTDPGTERITTWWLDGTDPARIVRRTCAGSDAARVDPHHPIVSRISDRDQAAAGVATSVAEARGQVAAECSNDGVSFQSCSSGDEGRVVRLTVRVPDAGTSSDPSRPSTRLSKTFQFQVAATREVQ